MPHLGRSSRSPRGSNLPGCFRCRSGPVESDFGPFRRSGRGGCCAELNSLGSTRDCEGAGIGDVEDVSWGRTANGPESASS